MVRNPRIQEYHANLRDHAGHPVFIDIDAYRLELAKYPSDSIWLNSLHFVRTGGRYGTEKQYCYYDNY